MDTDTDAAATAAPALSPSAATPTGSSGGGGAGGAGSGSGSGGGSGSGIKLAEPRRRNRPALSCIQCRTRKIRCDRNEPCASCMKSKIVNCTYEEARRPKPRLWRLSPAPTAAHPEYSPNGPDERMAVNTSFTVREAPGPLPPPTSNPSSTGQPAGLQRRSPDPSSAPSPLGQLHGLGLAPNSASISGSTAALAERVRQLEQQLADALGRPDHGLPSVRSLHHTTGPLDDGPFCKPQAANFLGNGDKFFPLLVSVADRIESDKSCDAYFFLQKCRELSSAIASTRVPSKTPLQLGHSIPAQATARPLVEAYFRTFESVYRILHAPTFWQEYREYWQNPPAASPSFVVQLQLCMAIGTCFQDDVIRLRHLASQWIYEAKFWLATSSDKSKVSITTLQTMCLLHLAKETCGIGGNLSWVSAGSLLQTAMFLGLHRDPDNLPRMSPLKAELRRRLWATVLEIVLQSSLDTGAPPLLTLSDFDTRSPSNYDDEQLLDYDEPPPSPKPPNVFTHSTVQVALLRSFPVRLSIAQYVNHFNSSATYQTTLKWNTELTNACRALQATFQPFYDPAGILPKRLSLFQLRLAEHMVHRFFLALNHPWLWSAHNDSAYYFSRKMCVETSLKLYRAIATGSPAGDSGTASPTDDFTRLATCGYGPFRSAPTLAVLTLCLELLWQVQEDRPFRQSLGIDHQQPERLGAGNESDVNSSVGIGIGSGAAPRHDLLEAVKYSIGWTQRRIRNGETNIKAHLLYTALLVQIQALQRGVSDVEVERQVFGAVSEELNRCWHLLKDVAASIGVIPPSNGAPSLLDGPNSGGWSALGTGWFASSKSGAVRGFHSIFDIHDADFFIGT